MEREAQAARFRVEKAQRELREAEAALRNVEGTCKHDWGEPLYNPDVRKAYTIPADPPGTMGVDWRPECHVPEQVTPRWTRTCRRCGKVETTTQTTEKVSHIPKF